MARSGTGRRVLVGVPDARVIGHAEPSYIVREGIDERPGLCIIPLLDMAVQDGSVAEPVVERVGRVDRELIREKLNEGIEPVILMFEADTRKITYWVILEVLANLSGVDDGGDAKWLKLSRVADAGQHHDLRGTNGAGREDYLLSGVHGVYGAFR